MDNDAGDWSSATGEPEATREGAKTGEAPEAAEEAEEKKYERDEYQDPRKLLLFKHWIRPRFLQYHYLYDYRRSYYDDVIDYLDKRRRGLKREIPRPQTWAERALRTYNSTRSRNEELMKTLEDTKLVEKMRLSGAFHLYHSREYVNRRYSSLLC